ncbi:menaquinone-dependent protoporphyrinogen IX dehydrogenase [Ramlibacter sp. AN1133]|uniref:menaquinone-dependent protoporphyrinogen IX dehydrogenase n=1 Tax=Ramlibacter sp. AN1133 TaxID=3133429 RepID=UPI0030C207C4
MSRILLAYSTVDGHTRTICERMQQSLNADGHAVTLASLSEARPPEAAAFDKVVIGASIRYGKHRPEVFDYIRRHQPALESRPSAFFTVNAVARKPGKDTPEGSPYIRSFRKLTPWRPALVGVFAGRIDYRKYQFFDRQIIRFIMWLTRGPTHPDACVEFTDWDSVEAFAQRVALL